MAMRKQSLKVVDKESKISSPAPSLLDPKFKYIPHAATDVQATWKRFGWTPPSEARNK